MKQTNYVDITNRVLIDAKFQGSTIVGEWKEGQTKLVEFFAGVFSKVHLISSASPKLEQVLSELCDDKKEKLAFSYDKNNLKISYIQLFSSNGCLIIKNDGDNKIMKEFLTDKKRIFITNKRIFFHKDSKQQYCVLKIRSINNGDKLSYIDNKNPIFYPWIDKEKISSNAHQILLYAAEVAAYYYSTPTDTVTAPSAIKSLRICF